MIAVIAAVLSLANASSAITAYENDYWHGQDASVRVTDCHRHSPKRIVCIARTMVKRPDGLDRVTVRDEAILLRHGIVKVHPGANALIESQRELR